MRALEALVQRVRRLSPGSRDPEAFFEERSEIANDLLNLAG